MLRNKLEITNLKAENGLMIGLSKDADWTLFEKLVKYLFNSKQICLKHVLKNIIFLVKMCFQKILK